MSVKPDWHETLERIANRLNQESKRLIDGAMKTQGIEPMRAIVEATKSSVLLAVFVAIRDELKEPRP
jgi:hypothetical protein